MLTSLLAMATLVMWAWPETPTARWLRRIFVDAPLALAGRMERRHVVFLLLVAAVLPLGAEFFLATGSADVAVALIWQASVWIDASLAVAAVTAFGRGGEALVHAARLGRRVARRGFNRRPRVQRRSIVRQQPKDEPHRAVRPLPQLSLVA
jgi:hypothetical protein